MSFHEIRFPASLSFGSLGGTEIVTLANGHEERNTPWAHSRRRYDAGFGLRSLDDVETLIAFFEAREGELHGFRWKDWADFKSSLPSEEMADTDQLLGIGDEVQTQYQLVKHYTSGETDYARPITKPVEGMVWVSIGGVRQTAGVDFDVDYSTGVVSFAHAPDVGGEVRAGFEFDVPVRFDTDRIQTSVASFKAGDVPSVPIVEIRV